LLTNTRKHFAVSFITGEQGKLCSGDVQGLRLVSSVMMATKSAEPMIDQMMGKLVLPI
jgi:hypothetical protein